MSSVIIDTHIVLWNNLAPSRLTAKARRAIDKAESNFQVIVCEITLWEIAILMKKNRLVVDMPYLEFVDKMLHANNYMMQGINPTIAYLAAEIDLGSKDPADRLIAATSITLGLPLISADQYMQQSTLFKTIW
jgi:PIN domain nuclease of toxin-antitoxin system